MAKPLLRPDGGLNALLQGQAEETGNRLFGPLGDRQFYQDLWTNTRSLPSDLVRGIGTATLGAPADIGAAIFNASPGSSMPSLSGGPNKLLQIEDPAGGSEAQNKLLESAGVLAPREPGSQAREAFAGLLDPSVLGVKGAALTAKAGPAVMAVGSLMADSAKPFFSKMREVLTAKLPNTAPVGVMKQTIENIQPSGFKAEELEDSGLLPWLEGQDGKVTKERVLDWLTEPQVDTVIKGEGGGYNLIKYGPRTHPTMHTPGGTNHQEMLLTLPSTKRPLTDAERKEMTNLGLQGKLSPEKKARYDELNRIEMAPRTDFTGGHFSEPNVLAHVRMHERTDADGKTLFVDELQSDWHQRGRKDGYTDPDVLSRVLKADERVNKMRDPVTAMLERNDNLGFDSIGQARTAIGKDAPSAWEFETPEDLALAQQYYEARQAAYAEARNVHNKIPDAPFKTTWPMLAMKRTLQHAIDTGADRIAWTTGAMQADRYDLSKQISEVHYSGSNLKAYDLNGKTVIEQTGVTKEQLPDIIGKDAAEKLLSQEPKGTLRSLTGQDLKVGGEGLKNFYDRELVNETNKYVKKMGGKVTKSQIETFDRKNPIALRWTKGEFKGQLLDTTASGKEKFNDNKAAMAYAKKMGIDDSVEPVVNNNVEAVHELVITPEMRAQIKGKGQPLYSAGGAAVGAGALGATVASQQKDQRAD